MLITTLLLSIFILYCRGGEVLEITTEQEMDDCKSQHKLCFVKFFAPWCGHCKRMKPAYDEAAEELAADTTIDAALGDVDCTQYQDLCSKYGVRGYPTLKYFTCGDGGDGLAYRSGRDKASIVKFVRDNTPSSCDGDGDGDDAMVKTIESKDAAAALVEQNKATLIGAFDEKDEVAINELKAVAETDKNPINVAVIKKGVTVFGHNMEPGGVYLVRHPVSEYEKQIVKYNGEFSSTALRKFYDDKRYGLVIDPDVAGPDNVERIVMEGNKPTVFVAVNVKDEGATKSAFDAVYPVAKYFENRMTFIRCDTSQVDATKLGINKAQGISIKLGDAKPIAFEGDITKQSELKGFLETSLKNDGMTDVRAVEVGQKDFGDITIDIPNDESQGAKLDISCLFYCKAGAKDELRRRRRLLS